MRDFFSSKQISASNTAAAEAPGAAAEGLDACALSDVADRSALGDKRRTSVAGDEGATGDEGGEANDRIPINEAFDRTALNARANHDDDAPSFATDVSLISVLMGAGSMIRS